MVFMGFLGTDGLPCVIELLLGLSPASLSFASFLLFRKASNKSTRSLHCNSMFLKDSCKALSVSDFG